MAVDGQGMGAILERVVVVARSQQVVVVGLRLAGHGDLAASVVAVPRLLRQVIGIDLLPLITDIRGEIPRLLDRRVAADFIRIV